MNLSMFMSKNDNEITGVALCSIKEIEYRQGGKTGYLNLKIKVSNQDISEREVQVNIFPGNSKTSISGFIEFFKTEEGNKWKDKLFYAELKINEKGYLNITNLFFKVEENELYYDPREKTEEKESKEASIEDIFEDF